MLKKIFTSAALLLAVSQLLSRALGVVRDATFSRIFGATEGVGIFDLDTYFAAFRIPDLVYNLLIFGVLSAAFVPLIARKNGEEVNRFASNVLNVLLVAVGVICLVAAIFAEPLTEILTPGFSATQILQTAELLRIELIAPVFFVVSAVAGGLAQHFHRFVGYALAPLFYNFGIIAGTIFWGTEFGVFGPAIGTAIGAGMHAAIQLPSILRGGWRWRPVFSVEKLRDFKKLAVPRIVALAAVQLEFVALTFFASLASGGALTIFNFAFNLAALPLGVVGLAFATSGFAKLSRLADNSSKFAAELSRNFVGVFFWTIPAAAGLFVLRTEITELILAGGNFGATDVSLVANSLAIFAIAIPAMSLLPTLNNAFFAQKNSRTPLLGGVLALAVVVAVAYFFRGIGIPSLAFAYAAGSLVNFFFLFFALRIRVKFSFAAAIGKILVAAAMMSTLVFFAHTNWPTADSFLALAVEVGAISILGGVFYLAAAKLLKAFPR